MNSIHVQSPLMEGQRRAGSPQSLLVTVLSVAVGALFIYAGAVKAWDPFTFANDIEHFRLLSWGLGMRLAFYLPWLEIFAGLALVSGRLRLGALALLSGLMVVFIGATIAAKVRGIDLNCGCFGHASKGLSFTSHLLLDFAVLGALFFLVARLTGLRHLAD